MTIAYIINLRRICLGGQLQVIHTNNYLAL